MSFLVWIINCNCGIAGKFQRRIFCVLGSFVAAGKSTCHDVTTSTIIVDSIEWRFRGKYQSPL